MPFEHKSREDKVVEHLVNYHEATMGQAVSNSVGAVLLKLRKKYKEIYPLTTETHRNIFQKIREDKHSTDRIQAINDAERILSESTDILDTL